MSNGLHQRIRVADGGLVSTSLPREAVGTLALRDGWAPTALCSSHSGAFALEVCLVQLESLRKRPIYSEVRENSSGQYMLEQKLATVASCGLSRDSPLETEIIFAAALHVYMYMYTCRAEATSQTG